LTDAAADTVNDGLMLETHQMMLLLLLVGSISDIEQSAGGRACVPLPVQH